MGGHMTEDAKGATPGAPETGPGVKVISSLYVLHFKY